MEHIYVDRMNSLGQGIGVASDGRTVFISGALPGETVSIAVREQKKSYLIARVDRVIERSESRRTAPCRWYRSCGGCQLQHADYKMQCRIKSMLLSDALRRIGRFDLGKEIPCIPSQSEWGYRNKASFPVRSFGQAGKTGFFKSGTHEIVPIDSCPVIGERANALYAAIKKMVEEGQFCCYNERENAGWLRHVVIRSARDCKQLLLLLVVAAKPRGAALESLEGLYDYLKSPFPELCGLVLNINPDEGNVILGSETIVVKGEDNLSEVLDEFTLEYDSTSFFQANPRQAERLFGYASGLVSGRNVVELYSGVGALTMYLAKRCASIKAVEQWPSAARLAVVNGELNNVEGLEVTEGDAANIGEGILSEADCVAMDPPRTGCEREVLEAIIAARTPEVLYISCDPATFARDAKILREGGYELNVESLRAFDMFPQTCHVESVALLKRAEG